MAPPRNGARLLDVTRLVSCLERGPLTGIDRVEYAYLDHLLQTDRPVFGLVRTALGFVLLDRAGCGQLAVLVRGDGVLGKTDLIGRLFLRRNPTRARAEAAVRRLAIARCARPFLAAMLRKLPHGSSYLNVGHANLTARCMKQLHRAGLSIAIMVHDTIPLDHPEFARPGTLAPFRQKMAAVARHADFVIHTTYDARAKTEAQLARLGRVPDGVVANLGVPQPQPNPAVVPPGLNLTRPYFIAIGTVEPRKNYELLLDVWESFGAGPDTPRLFIVGGRGWASPDLFARLDALPPDHPVKFLSGLPDPAVAALLQNAVALLFPSHAEGFGLPVVEAAALGVPVITSNLRVIKELLGDYAVYLDVTDVYSWMETIKSHVIAAPQGEIGEIGPRRRKEPPQWADHFKIVLRDL